MIKRENLMVLKKALAIFAAVQMAVSPLCSQAVSAENAATVEMTAVSSEYSLTNSQLLDYANSIISYEKDQLGINENDSLFSGKFLENAGQDSADWFVIGASRLGLHEDYTAYFGALAENIPQYLTGEDSQQTKATDWHRAALTVLACGQDPTDVSDKHIDLIEGGVYGRDEENSVGKQGLNGWIWSLIALDSLCWETPENCTFDRERIIDEILSAQLESGGFSLNGQGEGDVDITAMALQALSPYINDGNSDRVKKSVDRIIEYLSSVQQADGGFGSCEADAQVICGLCSAGVDIFSDERFIKDQNVFGSLLSYQRSDGGYAHSKEDTQSSGISSAQALTAIAAAARYENTMRRVYDFREEFSVLDREKLDAVNGQFYAIDDEESANHCNILYQKLSTDLKGYIYHYDKLTALKEKYNLSLADDDFVKLMSVNESGKGCIYDIENTEVYSFDDSFTQQDKENFERLEKNGAGSSDCILCAALISKLENSSSADTEENQQRLKKLYELKKQAEDLRDEINEINAEIMDGLYPFDELSKEQKDKLSQIYKRVQKLPESEREKVTSYSELCKAYEKAEKGLPLWVIPLAGVVATAVSAVCVYAVMRILRKVKNRREENDCSEEDN